MHFTSLSRWCENARPKPFCRVKSPCFHFASSSFNLQGPILSTAGDALTRKRYRLGQTDITFLNQLVPIYPCFSSEVWCTVLAIIILFCSPQVRCWRQSASGWKSECTVCIFWVVCCLQLSRRSTTCICVCDCRRLLGHYRFQSSIVDLYFFFIAFVWSSLLCFFFSF